MKVPYVNLKKENMESLSEIHSAIDNVIKSGNYILGKEVSKFENNFKNLTNSTYAVGVNSGTDALILALKALDIGENDEVITVSNTFIATVSAILEVNAKPVLVDVMDDQNINYNDIEKVITPRTKAIIPVHLSGKPSKMYEILKIADKYELEVIEDCAQAVTARIGNKQVGNFGKIGCFSLHPLKNLSAVGDAGVITTNDESIYRKIKLLRNHGLESRDTCVVWGVNSRIDEVQASILNVKLQKLDGLIQKRRQFAKKYIDLLNEVEGIILPKEEKDEYCTYNTFVIQVEDRDRLLNYLLKRGIDAKIHYPIPIHKQEVFLNSKIKHISLEKTELQAKKILSLPINSYLEEKDIEYVSKCIKNFFKGE